VNVTETRFFFYYAGKMTEGVEFSKYPLLGRPAFDSGPQKGGEAKQKDMSLLFLQDGAFRNPITKTAKWYLHTPRDRITLPGREVYVCY